MNEAVFTISKNSKGYNITNKRYNLYNQYNVPEEKLFETLSALTNAFNNVIGRGIVFEIEG